MYMKHNPARAADIDVLIAKYVVKLPRLARAKYGKSEVRMETATVPRLHILVQIAPEQTMRIEVMVLHWSAPSKT